MSVAYAHRTTTPVNQTLRSLPHNAVFNSISPLRIAFEITKACYTDSSQTPPMNTAAEMVGFRSEPRDRGTLSLLYTCLFTIFLCTWNAHHPDIIWDEGELKRILRHVKAALIAALLPEYYLYEAWKRLMYIRKMEKEVALCNQSATCTCTDCF
jgi:hypothetical protein